MASRICPNCGQEAPRTARFCSQCSYSLVGEPTIPRPPQAFEQRSLEAKASSSKTVLISVLGAAVVILLALAGFALNKYSSLLNSNVPISAPPVIQAPPPPPAAPPVTQAPTVVTPVPPVTQAPTPAPVVPPPAIVAYLSFVQQMEQSRIALDNAQVAAIMPLLGTAQGLKLDDDQEKSSGTNQINQAMSENLAKWQDLIRTFQQQTPPDGCQDLANSYYKFLQDYTDLSSQIQVALENGDTAKVMSLQGAQTQVDQDASAADGAVAAICTKYNAKKLFTISGEDGGGSGSSLLGL
jgi:hypothetical protein